MARKRRRGAGAGGGPFCITAGCGLTFSCRCFITCLTRVSTGARRAAAYFVHGPLPGGGRGDCCARACSQPTAFRCCGAARVGYRLVASARRYTSSGRSCRPSCARCSRCGDLTPLCSLTLQKESAPRCTKKAVLGWCLRPDLARQDFLLTGADASTVALFVSIEGESDVAPRVERHCCRCAGARCHGGASQRADCRAVDGSQAAHSGAIAC